jgi:hypothetical protein
MRTPSLRRAAVAVGLLFASVALAQSPKMIDVPLPAEEPAPGSVPATPEIQVQIPVPAGSGRAPRREPRKLQGESPRAMFGVWTVVQLTELGETEDYAIRMERAGVALDADCITTATWYDFGPPPTVPGLPSEVTVTEVQRCEKGGFGQFASETSTTVEPHWSTTDGVVFQLPEVRAEQQLIRLRAAEVSGRSPQNWVGPQLRIDHAATTFTVLAEYPPRQKGEGRPTALHLQSTNGAIYHLEPLGADE